MGGSSSGAYAVLATTTLSRSWDVRARLAVRTVRTAQDYGFPIVVVDASPDKFGDEFRRELTRAGAIVEQETTPGMGGGRRQAMRTASTISASPVVVWTEPEKHPLIPELDGPVRAVLKGAADAVIPARRSLGSYPPEQAHAESIGNLAVRYMLGRELDVWFGPMVLGQQALELVLAYDAAKYGLPDLWDSIHVPRFEMIAAGLVVMGMPVNYTHPPEQTAEETGDLAMLRKRIDQLLNLVPALQTVASRLNIMVAPTAP